MRNQQSLQSLEQWWPYIEQMHSLHIDLGLERILDIAQEMAVSQFCCPVIMVAGTNGKGSCAHVLERIYLAGGYRVGMYTSPHLLHFNERIRVNGIEVTDRQLLESFTRVDQVRRQRPLSFFEFTTLAALYIFQQTPLDVIILEVGLGGRLDAVNIVDADVAIVTTIGLDHTNMLGLDRDSIAKEKAGILRANKPIICGDADPPSVFTEIVRELKCDLYRIDEAFHYEINAAQWHWISRKKSYLNLPIPKLKLQNVAVSLMAVELLQKRLSLSELAVSAGIKDAAIPGRFEIIDTPFVCCIFDVAHNPQAAEWLAAQLLQQPGAAKTVAVVGMLRDKDITRTLAPLCSLVDSWYVAGLPGERGASSEILIAQLQELGVKNCYNFASIANAMQQAVEASVCDVYTRVIVFGSFLTVAEAKRWWAQHELTLKLGGRMLS